MPDTPQHPGSAPEPTESTPASSPVYRYEDVVPAPFELASGDGAAIEAISAHIEQHIGAIGSVLHELLSDQVHIDVHIVAPSADYPFYTLVTSGMSDRPMHLPAGTTPADDLPAYLELCILLPSTWPLPAPGEPMGKAFEDESAYWPIRWLKLLARFPHEYHTWLGYGHTLPNGKDAAPFADATGFGCMLLLPAISLPEEFRELRISPEKTVHFLNLYPLYREEMELKLQAGTDALLDRFEEYNISDVVDVSRPNTVG
ncbi:MAG: suppressor of fused domain protein [Hymenobacter sp.]|nr:MAG: suppressor of fused domain protein [Hymenobacter sp.]